MTTTPFLTVGQPVGQIEGIAKVTGTARYTADVQVPGMIWGRLLRSPYPHARIVSIDTAKAKALPGVHAVITAEDIPSTLYGRRMRDMPVLAQDKVRFIGEKVAAVAADTAAIAEAAIDLIDVQYEELPGLFDPLEAMKPDAVRIHPRVSEYLNFQEPVSDLPNVYNVFVREKGDIEQGFKESDRIFEHTLRTQAHHHGYMEPHACMAHTGDDGRYHFFMTVKTPHTARNQLSWLLGLPADQIVVHVIHIGGDFGGKGSLMDAPIAHYLSQASGKPVQIVMRYTEELTAGNPRSQGIFIFRTGVKNDGTLVAHDVKTIWNSGGYQAFYPAGWVPGGVETGGNYRIPHVRLENIGVYTNSVPRGHVRAPGSPQATFAIECHMDMMAKEMGIDPMEFRLKNVILEGEAMPTGEVLHDVFLKETLEAAKAAADWGSPKPKNVGRGIGLYNRHVGSGKSTQIINIDQTGSVMLLTAAPDTGTGAHTLLSQIVAEELQIPQDQVGVRIVDTDGITHDDGVGGSRVTNTHGNTAMLVAQQTKAALAETAAGLLGVSPEQVTVGPGSFSGNGKSLSFDEVARRAAAAAGGALRVEVEHDPGSTSGVACFTAQVAEVEVDPETGQVKFTKLISAHDVGTIINPLYHQGQIDGGVSWGIGFAITEDLGIDEGRVQNAHLGDYKLPVQPDMPELQTVLVQHDTGPAPYKAKGIGESSNVPLAAAIANAVYDATGVRITELPITPEKVYRALKEKQGQ